MTKLHIAVRRRIRAAFLPVIFFVCLAQATQGQAVLFDDGWKFYRGGAQRAEDTAFDDSRWRNVDLPHDWSIEDLPGTQSPFSADAISQVSGGFTVGGTGWYRKTFSMPVAQKGKSVLIQFDGVYMNADIWLNGTHVGTHPYGYTSFWFDLTKLVRFDGPNVLAVQVKNEGQNSRWYSGSGIYRHVWLKTCEGVYLSPWGIGLSTPSISNSAAIVHINVPVENTLPNKVGYTILTRLLGPSGKEAGRQESEQSQEAALRMVTTQDIRVKSPVLWSLDSPALYTAITEIYSDNVLIDRVETRFGIRAISFDATNGFRLNGTTLKLKGGCLHHDNGPLGARAYDRAEMRRVQLLKASGFNAVRCAHNPPSPAFLEACDRLGMLVIDEAFDMWRIGNNPYDYHLWFEEWWQRDIESLVLRDRNHPSVILWSIGNEIRDMENPAVVAVARSLANYVRQLDSTRPVTAAVNNLRPQKDTFFSTLDVCGYNYAAGGDHGQSSIYSQDHLRMPGRVMFGSESYALESFDAWMGVVNNSWVVGDFVWTAFDYIGEASIGWRGYWQEKNFYPWNLAWCGDIDICGWKRPQSYYRDAMWKDDQLSVFVKPPQPSFPINPDKQSWSKWEWYDAVADWNWIGHEGQPLDVTAYSSCEQTELFLNGKSLGKKPTGRASRYRATWKVPYQQGELRAVGYRAGKTVAAQVIQTSGPVTRLRLSADTDTLRANNQDLCYVTVEVIDAQGRIQPKADALVRFKIEGPGSIAAVGNANPISTESYQLPERHAWRGRCLTIIKASQNAGSIKLTATVEGLPAATVVIRTSK